jgi:hypothetical protein
MLEPLIGAEIEKHPFIRLDSIDVALELKDLRASIGPEVRKAIEEERPRSAKRYRAVLKNATEGRPQ